MLSKEKKKLILSGIIAVFLGALGSGLWNVMFEPIFTRVWHFLFNVFSFGIVSIRDSIYLEIAKGYHDQADLLQYMFLMALLFFIGFFFPKKISNNDDSHSNALNNFLKRSRVIYIFGILFFSVFFFKHLSNKYVNMAVRHYDQCYSICLPFMSDDQTKLMKSDFALIDTKNDYIELLEKLETIAKDNGLKVPPFNPL